ncbi:MAG TPA: glutamine amidotransferase family protein [Conexibacter sp.]|nr:glutamine amidotransferase family protein [Conexibacter sp.]
MCGIVGIFSKSPAIGEQLGAHIARMLVQMEGRGPDSAGVAFYRDPVAAGSSKLSLYAHDGDADWDEVRERLSGALGVEEARVLGPRHALFVVGADAEEAQAWVVDELPGLRVMSAGRSIEIYKETGTPTEVVKRFGLDAFTGTHALGHTRMATESRVTTEGSHPFSTGMDLCLVHNGSLSNHNRLRQQLRREGIVIQTQNDSEVAAGYLAWRMREGASLEQALESCLEDLDGFFTFAVGTADGFAVLRDPIACKPAVMAETDDWVAMASEYRALAVLPGADDAEVWEPEPARVYSWGKAIA